MAETHDGPQIKHLWPTIMFRHRLPGSEAANPVLLQLIHDLESSNPDLTTDYLTGNLLDRDHPAIAWLRDCINRAVVDYVRETDVDYDMDWQIQGWANVNRFGDYHNLHNHPHSWLSGTYYVQVPTEQKELPGRSDRTPGAISFFDPRPQANMTAVRGDPQIEAEHRITPEPGEILLWPAFLHHLVHPNLADEPRVSISFNIVLKWQDAFLPQSDA